MHKSRRRIPDAHFLLVVDADTAKAFTDYFESHHHYNSDKKYCAIHVASTGQIALESFVQIQGMPVVVVDALLPDMTRSQFLEKLSSASGEYFDPILVKYLTFVFLDDGRVSLNDALPDPVQYVWHVAKPVGFDEIEKILPMLTHMARSGEWCQPTTRLPCGKLIEERLQALLREEDWALLYMGIVGYESFEANCEWSFSKRLQRFVADLIEEVIDEYAAPTDFISHIGGDDFVVTINQPEKAEIIAQQLRMRFDSGVKQCYPTDSAIPQLKLAIGVIRASDGPFSDVHAITKRSSEARQQARTGG